MQSKATCPTGSEAAIACVDASAFAVPTDRPEADGTLEWSSTTMVVAEAHAMGERGVGYSYTSRAAATVIAESLAPAVTGRDAMNTPAAWLAMQRAVRNYGRQGICASAIAAVDAALWDLKGRLLVQPIAILLGTVRDHVAVYGSGGFTSDPVGAVQRQLADWVDLGIARVKMKVNCAAAESMARVKAAREAIGPDAELFVDANGACNNAAAALGLARGLDEHGVSWFEEPVTSDDLEGLARVRHGAPAGLEVAAGEYGYDLLYFRRMLQAGAVDVLQADATRCAGITGFLQVGALCDAFAIPLSAHTAPTVHRNVCCAIPAVRHVEYFHDHVRIEHAFFDGFEPARHGTLAADRQRPGLGFELKRADMAPYRVV